MDPAERTVRAERALEAIDSAAIGTLHSFAHRILTLHPVEANLPPLIEVLDEVASSVAFDERWSVLQRELLDEPALADAVLLALSAGVTFEHLRSLARAFGSDWDLIEDRVLPFPPPVAVPPDITELLTAATSLAARADECTDAGDKFLARMQELATWVAVLGQSANPGEIHAALTAAGELKWGHGRQQNWPDLRGLKASCQELQAEAHRAAATFANATLRPLAYWIASKVRESAQLRADEGRLDFHDLLVLARRVLRSNADVRAALHERFHVLLLDEFQDTDPIQIELAVRIAGGRGATAPRWEDVTIPAGSLFVVGDPKQSIYRFRRADIALFLDVRDRLNVTERLTTNFRTVAPVLAWVNQVFGAVIQAAPRMQPAYEPLKAHRQQAGTGPSVLLLGAAEHMDKPDASLLRVREASDVAAAITQAVHQGWTVWDEAAGSWRPVRLADMAILLPARTSLDFLEDALDAAGIAYRAESSSLVYQAAEIRDLMAVARAVADPTDLLSTVTALRSPVFGCGDDDLWAWKQERGSFNLLARPAEAQPPGVVRDGLDYLRGLHYRSRWMTPSELLATVVADRRMLEVAASGPRARDQWRRLRFVLDQARAWSDTEHGGLRGYLAWAGRQGAGRVRGGGAVPPETDLDAVRIMTIHAAKGLEFPMVLLSGMSSSANRRGGVKLLWPSGGGYSVRLNKSSQTNDFEVNLPIDEQMDNYERRRLLYVAATRAKDHLVVSLHRAGTTRTNARLLADAGALTAAADGVPFPAAMWCASLWGGSKARPLRRGALVPTCAGG
ncbi:MAG TPA: UvrD-helicase domain-containing protein, partial [Nakamurella sp.]